MPAGLPRCCCFHLGPLPHSCFHRTFTLLPARACRAPCPSYYRLAEALLDECVAHYVAAVLSFLRGVSEEDVAALRRDDAKIRQFFARYTKPEKVGAWGFCGGGIAKAQLPLSPADGILPLPPAHCSHSLPGLLQVARECQPLTDVCEFLTADSVESFVLSYTTLLTCAPGISPTLLANLINARAATDKNMTKADAREVSAVSADRHQACMHASAAGAATPSPLHACVCTPLSAHIHNPSPLHRCWTTAERFSWTGRRGQGWRREGSLRLRQRQQRHPQRRRPRGARRRRPGRRHSEQQSMPPASATGAAALVWRRPQNLGSCPRDQTHPICLSVKHTLFYMSLLFPAHRLARFIPTANHSDAACL